MCSNKAEELRKAGSEQHVSTLKGPLSQVLLKNDVDVSVNRVFPSWLFVEIEFTLVDQT